MEKKHEDDVREKSRGTPENHVERGGAGRGGCAPVLCAVCHECNGCGHNSPRKSPTWFNIWACSGLSGSSRGCLQDNPRLGVLLLCPILYSNHSGVHSQPSLFTRPVSACVRHMYIHLGPPLAAAFGRQKGWLHTREVQREVEAEQATEKQEHAEAAKKKLPCRVPGCSPPPLDCVWV